MDESLKHHGIEGQKWGVQNGPPYPLKAALHSYAEKRAIKNKLKRREKILKDPKKLAKHFNEFTEAELDEAIRKYNLRNDVRRYIDNKKTLSAKANNLSRKIHDKKVEGRAKQINSASQLNRQRMSMTTEEIKAANERLYAQDYAKQLKSKEYNRTLENIDNTTRTIYNVSNAKDNIKNIFGIKDKKDYSVNIKSAGYKPKLNAQNGQIQGWDWVDDAYSYTRSKDGRNVEIKDYTQIQPKFVKGVPLSSNAVDGYYYTDNGQGYRKPSIPTPNINQPYGHDNKNNKKKKQLMR